MASFNKVILMGNATRDVELRYIPSGKAVADLSLAVNNRRKSGDEWVEDVVFVDCTVWGRTAEVAAEYVKKGKPVLVEGKLIQDSWETPDGQRRTKLKVVVDSMQLLGGKPQDNEGDTPAVGDDDDLPI